MLHDQSNVLTGAKPTFSAKMALDILQHHWKVKNPKLSPLNSERDQNFKVETDQASFVLKIANTAEPFAVTNLQTQALNHIALQNPSIPIPRVISTVDGASEIFEAGSTVRVLTWVSGIPWHLTKRSLAQRRSIATWHAELVLALAGFTSTEPPAFLQWDVQHAATLADLLLFVPQESLGRIESVLRRFTEIAEPTLKDLPRQYGHNDLQPHNVVVDELNHDSMSGILDFGDMVLTPVACDLGVACAYHVLPGPHPLHTVGEYVAAFHARRPLSDVEFEVLPILTMARLATTIAIASWRASLYAANADYVLRNRPAAMAGLSQLVALPHEAAVAYLRNACR